MKIDLEKFVEGLVRAEVEEKVKRIRADILTELIRDAVIGKTDERIDQWKKVFDNMFDDRLGQFWNKVQTSCRSKPSKKARKR